MTIDLRGAPANLDTPNAADLNTAARKALAKQGKAMADGSFPIRNADDLHRAIRAVGRARDASHAALRRFIAQRAKALGQSKALPADWNADGATSMTAPAGAAVDLAKEETAADLKAIYAKLIAKGLSPKQAMAFAKQAVKRQRAKRQS